MIYHRKTKKSTRCLWVVLLSLALLCNQGVKLHVHSLGHDHHNHHDHQGQLLVGDHTHVSIAHLSLDNSHSDYHNQVIYESDACPDCLMTKFYKAPLTALLIVLFILLLIGVYRHTLKRLCDGNALFLYRFHFAPPLRAPPFD